MALLPSQCESLGFPSSMLEVWEPVASVTVDMMALIAHSHVLQVQLAPEIGEVKSMKRIRPKPSMNLIYKHIHTIKHRQQGNYTRATVHCVRLLC